MNIVDLIILGIVLMSSAYGVYRGFIRTAGSLLGGVASIFISLGFAPSLAAALGAKPLVSGALSNITDAVARVGDLNLGSEKIISLTQNIIDAVLKSVSLPEEVLQVLKGNIQSGAFGTSGVETVNDYVTATIVNVSVNILCFILVFAVSFMLINILINMLHHVFRFPVLRQMDGLAGALFGFGRGILIVIIVALVLPLVQTALPKDSIEPFLNGSRFLPIIKNLAGALFQSAAS